MMSLAWPLFRITEQAALAAWPQTGCGDKNRIDGLAVTAMRQALNDIAIRGRIVIGEGEIDHAPMLWIGEEVGNGEGPEVDIAVDPIEGTRMVAMGQSNALAVMAFAPRGSLLHAPDMYMKKLVVNRQAKGVINLALSLTDNLRNVARALNKPLEDLRMVTLDKPRLKPAITQATQLGVKVFALPDGDVAASVLTCLQDNPYDLMYTIGGAPEGVISACAVKALGGDMQASYSTFVKRKGTTLTTAWWRNRSVNAAKKWALRLTVSTPLMSWLPVTTFSLARRALRAAIWLTGSNGLRTVCARKLY